MNYRPQETNRLYRSNNSMIFGVCAGIAEHFDLPPWGVRLLFILLALIPGIGTFPMIILYIVMGMVLKRRPIEQETMTPNDPFQGVARGSGSHTEMLARVQERFDALDKRLQRMESIVTRPGFTLEQKYRDLQ